MIRKILLHPADLVVIIFAMLTFATKDTDHPYGRAIDSDGKGYYAYLPAIFIYDDLTFSFTEEMEMKYYPTDGSRRFGFVNDVGDGKKANQYFPGVAVLWLPFFLIAHFLSYITGHDPDGYSIIYQYAIVFASWFYLWLGCRLMYKLLLKYVSTFPAAFITLAVALGTGLFCYTAYTPAFTHTYSFALIAAFLYLCFKIFSKYDRRLVLLAVLVFGLISITRPSNIVVILLVPFAAGSMEAMRSFFKEFFNDKKAIAGTLALIILVVSLPMWLWYRQTGDLIVYSYGEHKFIFSDPQFSNNLFSYRKGLFVYTPLALISLIGLVQLYRLNRFRFITLFIFLLTAAYIISSWSWWWYGSGFGQRSYIDYYVVLGLLLAFLYQLISRRIILKGIFYILLPALMLVNVLQTYQHIAGYLPDDFITKEIYWSRFLKMKPSPPFEEDEVINTLSAHNGFNDHSNWGHGRSSRKYYERTVSFLDDSANGNAMYEHDITKYIAEAGTVLRVRATVYAPGKTDGLAINVSIDTGNVAYHWNQWHLKEHIDTDEWEKVEFYSVLPEARGPKNNLRVYFVNSDTGNELYIDDMSIDMFQPR